MSDKLGRVILTETLRQGDDFEKLQDKHDLEIELPEVEEWEDEDGEGQIDLDDEMFGNIAPEIDLKNMPIELDSEQSFL